jgi:hypothetical protein
MSWLGLPHRQVCIYWCPHTRRKEALTLVLELMVIVHVRDVPEHAPDQPENTEPQLAVADRVTTVPAGKLDPDGRFVTVPLPEPVFVTVRV